MRKKSPLEIMKEIERQMQRCRKLASIAQWSVRARSFHVGQRVRLGSHGIMGCLGRRGTTGVVTRIKNPDDLSMHVRIDGNKRDNGYLAGLWLPIPARKGKSR
jgi:hypothetical protein